MATIPSDQIAYKKRVGTLDGAALIQVGLIGGLHLIIKADQSGSMATLAAAPHPALAKHIAEKQHPEIEWTEFSKSDRAEVEHHEFLIKKYEQLTAEFQALEK